MSHRNRNVIWGLVFLLFIIFAILLAVFLSRSNTSEGFNPHKAVLELEDMIKQGMPIPEVSKEEIDVLLDNVLMIAQPRKQKTEGYEMDVNENTKNYFPFLYYDLQYPTGDWSPGLSTSLTKWSPGFYSGSGWYWWMRPNATYAYWPRSRWIRNNGKYYNMNNYGMFDIDKRSYNLGQPRNGFGQPVYPPSTL